MKFYLLIEILLILIIFINYLYLMYNEYNSLIKLRLFYHLHIIILNLRVAFLIPIISLMILFDTLYYNQLYIIIDVLNSFIEGYCILCFIKLQLLFINNKNDIINIIKYQTKQFWILNTYSKQYSKRFLMLCQLCIYQFVIIRPISILFHLLLKTNTLILDNNNFKKYIIYLLVTIQIVSIIIGYFGIIRLTITLNDSKLQLLNMIRKLTYLKVILLLLIIQNIIYNLIM